MNRRFVGVDVGAAKIAGAVFDGVRLLEPVLERTKTSRADALAGQLVGVAGAADDAAVVGVAVPPVVDWQTPLQDVAWREVLRERLSVAVFVDNDAGRGFKEIAGERGVAPGRVIEAARERDAGASAAIELLRRRLEIGIAAAINTFHPDLVVVDGGVSERCTGWAI
jgi:predicted NBD/HSP70 family sugar kinase